MSQEAIQNSTEEDDTRVVVTMTKKDYMILRGMIEERRSLNWLGKWMTNILFVAIGGFLGLVAFGDAIKQWILVKVN